MWEEREGERGEGKQGMGRGKGGKAVRDSPNVTGVVNVALYIRFLLLEVH